MDITKVVVNNLLEDYVGKPIEIKGLSERYRIEVHIIDTKIKDNKKGTGNVVQKRR